MVTGIEHLGIFAKDSKKLADWYIDMFGCTLVYENAEKGTYFVAFPDKSMIEICKCEKASCKKCEPTQSGLRHIALTVDDFEGMVEKIKESKLDIVTDAVVSANGVKTIFFRDIAGNILHLISRKTPLV